MERNARRFPNVLLILGVVMLLLGGCLLMWTSGFLPSIGTLWPTILILAGFLLLYLVFFRGLAEFSIFPGMFMVLGGFYFVLGELFTAWRQLLLIWPVFMGIAGISLVPYGLAKRGNARLALVIPGVAMVVLALVFLPFSLHVTALRFTSFVVTWWPVLLLVLGFTFLASHFSRGKIRKE